MKMKWLLIFAVPVGASVLAQPITNPPPLATTAPAPAITSAPPPAAEALKTNVSTQPAKKKAAAKKSARKTAPKKSAADELRTVPLVAGPAVVVASNVNVRGQATINSEVLTKLQKGEPVTVIEEITLKKSKPDEPSAWAKITLPGTAHAWVHGAFIDATNRTVLPRKLNLRGGPGENYSVIGLLKRGDAVKEVTTKGDWMEIEAPADAYAFVAAQYLKQEPPTLAATPTPPPEPAPAPTTVTETPPVAPAPTETPTTPPTTPTPAPAETKPAVTEETQPPAPRIVQREGLVRGTFSIQAPTKFALISADTGKTINYLHTTSPSLDLSRYKGLHIIVTGEEGLDERWKNTPVITIQRIQVLE
jgi:hypothetical protein